MTDDYGNMTYLFDKPFPSSHNSESFWTTIFALFILFSLRMGEKVKLTRFSYQQYPTWKYIKKGYYHINNTLNFNDIIIEGTLSNDFIGLNKDLRLLP